MSKTVRGYPHLQPFNVTARPNKTKRKSWFYRTPPQNNTQPKGEGL